MTETMIAFKSRSVEDLPGWGVVHRDREGDPARLTDVEARPGVVTTT